VEMTSWTAAFSHEFSRLAAETAAYLPRLLLAVAVLVIGWFTARLTRAVSVRLLLGIDRLWHQFISHTGYEQLQPHYPPAKIAGMILFWFVMLFFIAAAASILGLGAFVNWLSSLATYIPILLTGLLIILTGVIVSALVRDIVTSAGHRAGIARSELLGRLAQAATLVVAVAVGIDQLGVDISFLSIVVGIALAATFGSMALAFGFGARTYMSNIIAGHQLRRHYHTGDKLRIRDYEGTIAEFTTTKVVLNTEQGRVIIPASLFENEISILPDRARYEGEQ
jgi:small-conductance mechanosensitive channel